MDQGCASDCCMYSVTAYWRVLLAVDPVDLDDDVSVSTGDDSECFMSVVSDGSLPDSESADEFASCSSHDDYD